MANEADWGCLLVGGVAIVVGIWGFDDYEIRKRDTAPVALPSVPAPQSVRPHGLQQLTIDKDGSVWALNADTVSGDRRHRQGWIIVDSSKDKTTSERESRTLYYIDCDTTAARRLSVAGYDPSGKNISASSHDPKDAEVEYFPPGTIGYKVVETLCDKAYGR